MLKRLIIIFLIGLLSISAVSASNETAGSFNELQDIIDSACEGSTINLTKDYVNDMGSEINIDKTLTINGNNHILDGKSKSGIFNIQSPVILNDIIFVNGKSSQGGAVLQTDGGEINNCVFKNNEANMMELFFRLTVNSPILNSSQIVQEMMVVQSINSMVKSLDVNLV